MAERQFEREVAKRLFAQELRAAVPVEKTGNGGQYEPKYVQTELGEKINRIFICGVITEKEDIGKDGDTIIRARIADPTGAFVVYAGQYQPDVRELLARVEVPEFVAVVGKVSTYSPADSGTTFVSIRPERINVADERTRDCWVKETADLTMERINASNVSPEKKEAYETMVQAALKSVSTAS